MKHFPGNLREITENNGSKHVGGDQITQIAGIIARTEAGPDEAAAVIYQSALSATAQALTVERMTGKVIRGFLLMVLLGAENFQDRIHALAEGLVKMSRTACELPQEISQLNRVAERIDLVFSLPDAGILILEIFFPAGTVGLLIESVGVRIDQNAGKLSLYQAFDHICQL